MGKTLALALIILVLTGSTAMADMRTQKVNYQDGETQLVGVLAYDDATSYSRPGVVVVHEWWGVTDFPKKIAERLAGEGYVALAIDMYGQGKTTTSSQQAAQWAGEFRSDRQLMRRRALAGLEQLKKDPRVDGNRVAAIGFCFGGTVALEMARAGAPLRGVVSFHGGLDTPNPEDAKNIKASVLVLAGGDDPHVPDGQIDAFKEEMRKAHVDWIVTSFGGAMHSYTNPASNSPANGLQYNEKAARRAWQAMSNFLAEVFKQP